MAAAATPTNNNQDDKAILLFEFEEKLYPGVTIADTEDIRFIWDEKDTMALRGFEITVKPLIDGKVTHAEEQTAPSLANILSGITGIPITYKPPQVTYIRNGLTTKRVERDWRFSWLTEISIKHVDLSKLSSMLHTHSKMYMIFAHAHNGQKAFFRKDYPQAIREYFLIFEYSGRREAARYRNLRNAVSHVRLDDDTARADLKNNFGIDLQKGQELDVDDPTIKQILYKYAREFRRDVGLYLQEQLRKELAKP